MHAGADLEPDCAHAVDDRLSAANRAGRAIEGGEEPVTGGINLATTKKLTSSWRISAWCVSSSSRHARSPSSAARSVEPTMSVNITVASTRSCSGVGRTPVRNSCTSSSTASASPTYGRWSLPGSCTSFARGCATPGRRSAPAAVYTSSRRWRTSVGTRIDGRIARTSMSEFMWK